MRSRLTARSARLVLAAAAVAALAATTTACDPEDNAEAIGSTAPSAASSAGTSGSASAGKDGGANASDGSSTRGSGSGGSDGSDGKTAAGTGSGSGDKSGYGQSCGTNDLDMTVTWEARPISHYRVTAKAKSGITCYLDVNTPSVSFGSDPEGLASPVGQGGEDPIKLSGSAVAYAGINPKSTGGEGGTQFDHVIVATTEDDPNPADLELPDMATVEKPLVTNWSTKADETIPRAI
ncbi:hypothetical protein ACFU6R_18440 [Streptomyces sp. NPDC057499]|uniref:hypothetical protein n=1 Tax=Streptomyces sp. NPDC057499 TaxID=3346150 RepID=UPI0036A81A0F